MRKYTRKTNRKQKRAKHSGSLELRGAVWIARWMVNGKRKSQSTGETDRAAAEKWLARQLASVRASDIRATSKKMVETLQLQKAAQLDGAILQAERSAEAEIDKLPTIPIAELEKELRAVVEGKVSENTVNAYANEARKLADWIAKEHPEAEDMNDITEAVARQYADWLAANFRAVTHKGGRATLSHIWHVMAERYRIKANPWRTIKPIKKDAEVRRDLTREELAKIAATLQGEYRTAFFVGCFTGLRLSDAATLKWESIDLNAGVVTLRPIKTARTSGRYVEIPIVPEFYAVLATVPAESRHGYLTPGLAQRYRENRSRLSVEFVDVFANAGIKTRTEGGKGKPARNVVGFHSLRHTFVSIAANAGIPLATVQSIVGHSAAKMSAHYFHENREANALAFRKFPALFATAPKALPDRTGGDVIEAEIIEATTATADTRRAALDAILAEIARDGDEAERKATAERLAQAASELAKGATAKA